jgi:predicted Zn-dependent protease
LAMADQLAKDKANLPAAGSLKGDLLLSRQSPADALAAYQDAYRAAPSSLLAIRIALAQQAAGNAAAGQAELRDWLGAHPDDADAAQVLAGQDITARRYDAARGELQTVLRQRPDDVVALNNLAIVDQQSNDLGQARLVAQRAYLLASTPQTTDTLGWIILQQGDVATALPLLRQAAAELKDDPGVQYHLAAALQRAGRSADAKAILQALGSRPGSFPEKPDADKLLATLAH